MYQDIKNLMESGTSIGLSKDQINTIGARCCEFLIEEVKIYGRVLPNVARWQRHMYSCAMTAGDGSLFAFLRDIDPDKVRAFTDLIADSLMENANDLIGSAA